MIPLSLDVIAVGAISSFGRTIADHPDLAQGPLPYAGNVTEYRVDGYSHVLAAKPAMDVSVRPLLASRKTEKFLSRDMKLALAATAQIKNLLPENGESVGIVHTSGPALSTMADIQPMRDHCVIDGIFYPERLGPNLSLLIPATWTLRSLKATCACHLATELGWTGPNVTLSPRPTSALSGIFVADLLLAADNATAIVVGASDSRIDEISVNQAVLSRMNRDDGAKDLLGADHFTAGFAEGAATIAVVRRTESKGPGTHLNAYCTLTRPNESSSLSSMVADVAQALRASLGAESIMELWIDAGQSQDSIDLGGNESLDRLGVSRIVNLRERLGDIGVASGLLAVALGCYRLQHTSSTGGRAIAVLTLGTDELNAVLIETSR